MLDLTPLNNNLYEIRLLDGTELHLKRPSQGMVQFLIGVKDAKKGDLSEEDLLKTFASLFTRILNRNVDDKIFNNLDLEEDYDYQTIAFVIEDYFDYWEREDAGKANFQRSLQES